MSTALTTSVGSAGARLHAVTPPSRPVSRATAATGRDNLRVITKTIVPYARRAVTAGSAKHTDPGIRVVREDRGEVSHPEPALKHLAEHVPVVVGAGQVTVVERPGCQARPLAVHLAAD